MNFDDKTIVISGAGSGMGRELALNLAARGCRLAVADLNPDTLAETCEMTQAGERISSHVVNVTDREAVLALPDQVIAAHGAVDAVINNAGVIQPFKRFEALSLEEIDRMISVNLTGCINMTYAFLPHLKARSEAHLCNVTSMGGFIPFPGQTMYSASKAAVKLMTEGIYAECLDGPVEVSVVMPGAVATNITENSGVKPPEMTSDGPAMEALAADEAARQIIAGIEAGKLHILVGKDANSLWRMTRFAPAWAIRTIQKNMKKVMQI